MNVYWLEQKEEDVPDGNDWLGERERIHLSGLRFLKRRSEWRMGRWTAKCAVISWLGLPICTESLASVEICASSSGAPQAFEFNKPAGISVSISHRAGRAMCAIADAGVKLGCDLEVVEPHADAFLDDYFTLEELRLVIGAAPGERPRLATLLWSAKESALKALQVGLRVDTRKLVVHPDELGFGNHWFPLHVESTMGNFHGWWREEDGALRTLVADPSPEKPIQLLAPQRTGTESCNCRPRIAS